MLLLDSQTTLWVLDDNPRLGPTARQMIVSAVTVYVSAATVWELTIKAMLGKLSVPDKFTSRLAEQGLVLLNITAEISVQGTVPSPLAEFTRAREVRIVRRILPAGSLP